MKETCHNRKPDGYLLAQIRYRLIFFHRHRLDGRSESKTANIPRPCAAAVGTATQIGLGYAACHAARHTLTASRRGGRRRR